MTEVGGRAGGTGTKNLLARRMVVVAMEPQRKATDFLDAIEYLGALLFAYRVAEQAA